jgi:hypothetical protein
MYVKTENGRVVTLSGIELNAPTPSKGWLAYQAWLADGNQPVEVTAERQPLIRKNASAREYRKAQKYYRINEQVAVSDMGVRVTAPQASDEWLTYLDWCGEGNRPQERFTQKQWNELSDEARKRLMRQRPLDAHVIDVEFANGDIATVTYCLEKHQDEDDENGNVDPIIEIDTVIVKGKEIAPTFARETKIRKRILDAMPAA